jgi:hypothetical protein
MYLADAKHCLRAMLARLQPHHGRLWCMVWDELPHFNWLDKLLARVARILNSSCICQPVNDGSPRHAHPLHVWENENAKQQMAQAAGHPLRFAGSRGRAYLDTIVRDATTSTWQISHTHVSHVVTMNAEDLIHMRTGHLIHAMHAWHGLGDPESHAAVDAAIRQEVAQNGMSFSLTADLVCVSQGP